MPPSARHHTPTHRPTSPTTTDCTGRLMACRQQTAPPQKLRSKDDTAHPHQPGARPEPPNPDPAHSLHHYPAKAKVKFPLRNRIFFVMGSLVHTGLGSSSLVSHVLPFPPPPPTQTGLY
jgi:hypothetical protein